MRPDDEETRAASDPAVLLFRDGGDINKRLLVVFLVAETPIRGINKVALRGALDQIASLSGWQTGVASPPQYLVDATCRASSGAVQSTSGKPCSGQHREIRIVGPTFSGSAVSMRNTLIQWLGVQKIDLARISILSGTATAIGDKLTLSQRNGNASLDSRGSPGASMTEKASTLLVCYSRARGRCA